MSLYESCTLCPRMCGRNRTAAERGVCGMGDALVLARAALHHWEEPCISASRGSGTVFFSGCPLGCVYCQNREIAQGHAGRCVPASRLSKIFHELAAAGAHNINLVTATHYTPTVVDAIVEARRAGLDLPIVWNTSGYERVETLRMLAGHVNIYLTDYRYTSSATADAYSHAPDYPTVAWDAIAEMVRQTGACRYDEHGVMTSGTIVRILLLPTHLIEAKQAVLRLWRAYGDTIRISLMQQYTPMEGMPPPLDRRVTATEYDSLVRYAATLGITTAYTQSREAAQDSFIPPFDDTGV